VKDAGRLDDQDFPEIVQQLGQQRWTGVLRLQRDGERIGITMDGGRLVFASTSNPDYRLGPRLLRRGVITLQQMEEAVRRQPPDKRFGTVLVEMGFMAPKELVHGVTDQTRDIILLAFHWTSGDYRLEPGPAAGEAITLDMSTPQLILDGVSQIEAWGRVERGSGGLAARYAPVPGSEGLFKQLTLDVDQAALLRSIKEVRDVESLLAKSMLNHFEACRTLWAFRVIGLVRRVEATILDDDGLEFVLPPEGE
jgi:Domain of unknown function (DUF4388)